MSDKPADDNLDDILRSINDDVTWFIEHAHEFTPEQLERVRNIGWRMFDIYWSITGELPGS